LKNIKEQDNTSKNGRARGFMIGVLLLSFSTLIVKIIGLAFKIPMLSFLGTEGMGYFNSAYEIYALLCTISTAGLPVALSMLVSEARTRGDGESIKKIYSTARGLFLALGSLGSFIMLAFARQLSFLIGNPDAYLCIMAIAPALLFICVASAVRGYCQGFENMMPTALSQLIEALAKLILGIAFAMGAISRGMSVPKISAMAVLGVTSGTFLSALYLLFAKLRVKRKNAFTQINVIPTKKNSFLRDLISIAFPITLGSALLGITRIIDMTLIMRRLQNIGLSVAETNSIYGSYTTLAVPVFSLIPALITPVSMALVPQLASFVEEKSVSGQRTVIENSIRLTVLFSLPSSFGLAVFSKPILELIFKGQSEAISVAAPLLAVLGISVLFSCMITTTNAILQAYRKATLPIVSMLVGVGVKFAVSYFLIGNQNIGVMGAPIGSLACNVTVSVMNLLFLSKNESCILLDMKKIFLKPLFASLLAVGAAVAVYVWLGNVISGESLLLFIAILLSGTVYITFSLMLGSISRDDVALLPMGERILNIFCKNKNTVECKNVGGENDGCTDEKNTS